MIEGILSGLRVVEVSAFVAAPLTGATLASLGAEVIRVEQVGGGLDARRWPVHQGRSLYRAGLDRGKRSVALDLRAPRGQEIVAELVTSSGEGGGIIVTNLGRRDLLSYDQLAARRSDVIVISIEGTDSGGAAVDYTVNAGIGFPWVTGPGELIGPVDHVLPAWDVATGFLATTGLLAAERHRRATGEGQLVRVALSDVALAVADHLGFLAEAALIDEPRGRYGNDLFGSYGRDFRTSDGRHVMLLALTRRQWTSLARATQLEDAFREIEAKHGVDLSDEGARFTHRGEISALIEAWAAARTLAEVATVLDEHGALWGPYRTFKEFVRDEPRALRPPTSPLSFASHPRPDAPSAPELGADTRAVLSELLQLTPETLDELSQDGVIA